jgi:hypothetical protein
MLVISDRPPNAVEEDRVIERLCEIRNSTTLQNLIAQRAVRERRDENYWHVDIRANQVLMKVEPIHPRHLHVSDETVRFSRPLRSQECFSRVKSLDVVSERFDQTARRGAYRIVVIHNRNYKRSFHLGLLFVVRSVWSGKAHCYCASVFGNELKD